MSRYLVWLLGGGTVAAAGTVALWLTTGMRDAPVPTEVATSAESGPTERTSAATPPAAVPATPLVGVPAPEVEPADTASAPDLAPDPAPEAAQPSVMPPTFDVVRVARDGAALVAGSAAPGAAVTLRVDGAVVAEAAADGAGQFVSLFSLAPGAVPQVMTLEMQDAAGVVMMSDDTVILSPRRADLALLAPDAGAGVSAAETAETAGAAGSQSQSAAEVSAGAAEAEPEPGMAVQDDPVGSPVLADEETVDMPVASDPAPAPADVAAEASSSDTVTAEAPVSHGTESGAPEAARTATEMPLARAPVADPSQLAGAGSESADTEPVDTGSDVDVVADSGLEVQDHVAGADPEADAVAVAQTGVPASAAPRETGTTDTGVQAAQIDTVAQASAGEEPGPAADTARETADPTPAVAEDAAGVADRFGTSGPVQVTDDVALPVMPAPDIAAAETGAPEPRGPETGVLEPFRAPAALAEAVAVAIGPDSAPPVDAADSAMQADLADDLPTAILLRGDGQIEVLDRGPRVMDNVVIDTISYSETGDVQISGRAAQAESGADLRIYLDNRAIAVAQAEGGDWRLDLPAIDPGVYRLRVDQLNAAGRVVSRFETPFQRETPERVAAAQAATRGPAAGGPAGDEQVAGEPVAGGPAVMSEAPSGGVEPAPERAAEAIEGEANRAASQETAADQPAEDATQQLADAAMPRDGAPVPGSATGSAFAQPETEAVVAPGTETGSAQAVKTPTATDGAEATGVLDSAAATAPGQAGPGVDTTAAAAGESVSPTIGAAAVPREAPWPGTEAPGATGNPPVSASAQAGQTMQAGTATAQRATSETGAFAGVPAGDETMVTESATGAASGASTDATQAAPAEPASGEGAAAPASEPGAAPEAQTVTPTAAMSETAVPAVQGIASTPVQTAAPAAEGQPPELAGASPAPPRVSLITVQPGHTLWHISDQRYGAGERYVVIYRANRSQIRNPDLIYPGQIFTLPDE